MRRPRQPELTRQQQEQKHRDGNDHEGQAARTDAVTNDATEEQQRNDTRVPLDLKSHNASTALRTSGDHDQHLCGVPRTQIARTVGHTHRSAGMMCFDGCGC
jgi:hypothetical protein